MRNASILPSSAWKLIMAVLKACSSVQSCASLVRRMVSVSHGSPVAWSRDASVDQYA